ncbi:MAG: flagellar biosynthetic protein FliO [Betaproteobacteria bacterium]|jgi:flagellar biosynthetic protein FliO|nr:flagellar biosynthetic protein FliO [Betaproteobacteria bacterium]
MKRCCYLALGLGCSWSVWGEGGHPAYQPPELLTWSSGLQVVLSLGFVLALMAGVGWFLKRYSWYGKPRSGDPLLRIVGSVAVGQRERVVVVELENTWVMVGVAPGQVESLHVQPKPEA